VEGKSDKRRDLIVAGRAAPDGVLELVLVGRLAKQTAAGGRPARESSRSCR